jgi:hypothetical protein
MYLAAADDIQITTATIESLKTLLSVPIITTAVLALSTLAIPTIRWTRQLKSDLAVFNDMPEGDERSYWRQRVEEQSMRLRTYRTLVPWWDRLLGWIVVVIFAMSISFWVVLGVDTTWMRASDWVLSIMALFMSVYVTINTLRGATFHGLSPEGYVSYIDSERQSFKRADARRLAGRRLRQSRRAERDAARAPSPSD